jgi:hypothetical protein
MGGDVDVWVHLKQELEVLPLKNWSLEPRGPT